MKYLGETIALLLILFAAVFLIEPERIGNSARMVLDAFNAQDTDRDGRE